MNFNQLKAIANECVFSMEGITVMKTEEYNYRLKQINQLTNNWNELEEDINNQLMMTRKFDDYNEGYFDATLHYYNKMKEIKERTNNV